MEFKEAKKLIGDVLAEVCGDTPDHKLPEGVSSEDFVKDNLQDVYTDYFCNQ